MLQKHVPSMDTTSIQRTLARSGNCTAARLCGGSRRRRDHVASPATNPRRRLCLVHPVRRRDPVRLHYTRAMHADGVGTCLRMRRESESNRSLAVAERLWKTKSPAIEVTSGRLSDLGGPQNLGTGRSCPAESRTRIRRARSRSDFWINRITSHIFAPNELEDQSVIQ